MLRTVSKYVVGGAIVGFTFDQLVESRGQFVNHGHRNSNGGDSFYALIGNMCILPPLAIVIIPCALLISPGVYISNKLDKMLYPERWEKSYRTPQHIKWMERMNKSGRGGGGTGIPQIGDFF
jgi:hypothetical protein